MFPPGTQIHDYMMSAETYALTRALHIVNSWSLEFRYPPILEALIIHPIVKSGDGSSPSNFRPSSSSSLVFLGRADNKGHAQQSGRKWSVHSTASFTTTFPPTAFSSQHCFRPRHSTETALLPKTDDILSATDSGKVSLCLIDLSKCFDVIDHQFILRKLALYNIDTA